MASPTIANAGPSKPCSAISRPKASRRATHLTYPDKLCTLLALMAFGVALAVKIGVAMARLYPILIKKHVRSA